MARVRVAPIEPLEIEFADGTLKTALFNNEAFSIFESEFGALDILAQSEGEKKPYEFCSKILYCGLKVVDRDIELDEARNIVFSGGLPLMGEVMSAIMDNLTAGFDEEIKENFYQEVGKKIQAMTRR